MKLIRFGKQGEEQPGLELEDGTRIDIAEFGEDYNERFFGSDGISRLAKWIKKYDHLCPIVPSDARLGPPIVRPSKIICIGLNYAKHAAESGMDAPTEPVLFAKATSAIIGPYDDVVMPKGGDKTDWEVELGVVIGKTASYVDEANTSKHIAGYMIHNDVSERSFQLERGGQWVKGKSCDTFAPIGPYLVTPDEIDDPHNLRLWLKVNDQLLQDSNTSDLIFNIPHLISYVSQYMTLLPGDIISTGTPSGVGLGFDPPRYLKEGDVVELGIDGLGVARQMVRSYN